MKGEEWEGGSCWRKGTGECERLLEGEKEEGVRGEKGEGGGCDRIVLGDRGYRYWGGVKKHENAR